MPFLSRNLLIRPELKWEWISRGPLLAAKDFKDQRDLWPCPWWTRAQLELWLSGWQEDRSNRFTQRLRELPLSVCLSPSRLGVGTNHRDKEVPFLTLSEMQVTWAWPGNRLPAWHERWGNRKYCQRRDQKRLAQPSLLWVSVDSFF